MKPKFGSRCLNRNSHVFASLFVCASLCATASVHAAKTWSGATDGNWATTTNWVEGALPGTTETVIFDANSTANLSVATGANRTIRGISLSNPAGNVAISANTLTLGDGGINMSSATADLAISSGVAYTANALQKWNVATGRSITVTGAFQRVPETAANLQIGTTGTVKLGAAALTPLVDAQGNPYATYGLNDWAATDATGTVIASSYTNFNASIGATFPSTPLNVTASFTQTGNGGAPGIRFADTAVAQTLTFAATTTFTGRGVLVTSDCAGGTITGGFLRPNRSSGGTARIMNVVQNSPNAFTIASNLSNSSASTATLLKTGPGKLILTANNGYTSGTRILEGSVQLGNGGTTGLVGSGDIVNNAELIINRSDTFATLIHNISGTGSLTHAGSGEADLTTSVSTFTGAVNITGGTLGVTSMANLGSGTVININGGFFKFLGNIDPSVRSIVIGSSGAGFDTNGNNITLANAFASGSTGSLTKRGAGVLTLPVANDYSGGTTVNAGTLQVTGSGATGSGGVTINTGATIAGTGTVAGNVTVASGAAVKPGTTGVSTLTVGGLTLDAGSTATLEFNTSPANDQVTVSTSGGLTINGGAITLVQEGTSTAFTTPGTYNLIGYSGAISGSGVSSLSVANPQPGFSYSFSADGSNVKLTIGTVGVVSQWITDGSGSWANSGNWNNGVPDANGATANLTTALTAPATVSLNGGRTVGSVTFNSATNGYTIDSGSGGSLTINNGANPAAITNNGGTHVISAPVVLSSNTSLPSATAAESLTLSAAVSGTGTLTKTGAGQLTLSASNTFSGLLTLNGGTTTFANGGLGAGDLVMSGSSLVWTTGNTQDISNRSIAFGDNPVTFDTNGNDVSLANAIGEFGNAAFTKAGLGKLTIVDECTSAGNVTISGGTLQVGSGGTTGAITGNIINNGALLLSRSDSFLFSNVISGTGTLEVSGGGNVQLSSVNTFSGSTTIVSGGITLIGGQALQNSTLNYSTGGGSLSFGTLTAATLGGLSGDKNLVLENSSPAGVALTVGGNNESTSYSGVLSGTGGSLVKNGTGILTLSAAQTYDGATSVNAGELLLDTGASIGGSALNTSTTGRVQILDGSATAPVANLGVGSGGLYMLGGSATVSGAVNAAGSTGSTNSAPIRIYGGSLSAGSIVLGRGGLNQTAEPTQAPVDIGLYVAGGNVTVSGTLYVGTFSAQPNSSVVTRIDSGSLTVNGAISVGLNNGGRWSILDINGGTTSSTGTGVDSGVVLGGPWVGKSALLVRNGIANIERIQLGRGALGGAALVHLTGGELYLGSEGIVLGTTEPGFLSEIRLGGGTLGAKAAWSSSLPINLSTGTFSTIKAANSGGTPFNITLSGAVTGAGNLDKTGGGTLTLAAGNASTGITSVMEGVLKVQSAVFDDACTVSVEATAGAVLNLDFTGGDRVAVFEIDGVAQADGIYGAIGSGAQFETSAITGTGRLYVNTSLITSQYANWATSMGLTSGVNDGANQDPDNDGISNQLEFVLGGNPLGSSSLILPTLSASGTDFVFTFSRSDESESEVSLVFQYGSNLTGWTDVAVPAATAGSVTVTENGASADTVVVTIPKGSNTKLFGRLQSVK